MDLQQFLRSRQGRWYVAIPWLAISASRGWEYLETGRCSEALFCSFALFVVAVCLEHWWTARRLQAFLDANDLKSPPNPHD